MQTKINQEAFETDKQGGGGRVWLYIEVNTTLFFFSFFFWRRYAGEAWVALCTYHHQHSSQPRLNASP